MYLFKVRYSRLRTSIASKAGVTKHVADVFLTLGQPPISMKDKHKLQNPKTPYSPEEQRFIVATHSFASTLLQVSLAPVIPVKQKKAPAKRKQSGDSEKLDKLIIKMTKEKSTTKDIVSAAQKKFPSQDIDDCVIRSRKSRLRKLDKLI